MKFHDQLITDFNDLRFQSAFRLYFDELGVQVTDWAGLWREMNGQEDNRAYLRTTDRRDLVGFLQFCPIVFSSWFFEAKAGFIREFWVAPLFRGQGHGSALLAHTEDRFCAQGLLCAILTSDTAPGFYLKNGYHPGAGFKAKNHDPVLWKLL